MRDFAAVSRAELAERRRRLRRQRRLRLLQATWRLIAVAGLAGGLVWVITRPTWVIRNAQQVEVQGNRLLPIGAVQSLLPIAYPQSLFQLQPEAIAQQLETQPPIAEATVTRRLFPPRLIVEVRERQPVAIAFGGSGATATPVAASPNAAGSAAAGGSVQETPGDRVGLLDRDGTWVPLESYTALNPRLALPSLKVFGMRDQYRSQWSSLYQTVNASPIKIFEVDWRKSDNLILKTELGAVHLGSFGPQFTEQLKALDQMRQLPDQINPAEISYIDLKNPAAPMIQMVQDSRSARPTPAEVP